MNCAPASWAGSFPAAIDCCRTSWLLKCQSAPRLLKKRSFASRSMELVASPLRKGAVVRRFTRRDVEELYEARLLVEQNAVRTAIDRKAFTPELLARLDRTLVEHERFAGRKTLDDTATALTFNSEFHHQFVPACGQCPHRRLASPRHAPDEHGVRLRRRATLKVIRPASIGPSLRASSKAPRTSPCEALRKHLEHSRANTLANVKN